MSSPEPLDFGVLLNLAFGAFKEGLDADLAAAGLEREQTTYADAAGRYLVTARRAADEPAGSAMMRPGHDRGGLP